MIKERIFRKKIIVDNFLLLTKEEIAEDSLDKAKPLKKEAELVAQIHYTPRGYFCEVEQFSPMDVWNEDLFCKIEGINDGSPEGDLSEKFFDTKLASMHFITRRLKRLGWDPLDGWHNS
jgi:hypothetical protein